MKKPITPFQATASEPRPSAEKIAWVDAFIDAVGARNLEWFDPEAVHDDGDNAFELIGATTTAEEAARVYVDEPKTPWIAQARDMPGTNFA